MGGFTPELKAKIKLRDGTHCVRCGDAAHTPDVHHRNARGMGGRDSHEWWINDHSNLLTLCQDCHRWIEKHRDEAKVHGWLLKLEYGQEPSDVLVHYYDGQVYRLHGDFFLTPVDFWREGMDVRELVA